MSYWSTKWHGFKWGWYQEKANTESSWWLINNYDKMVDPAHSDGRRYMFQFGNDFGDFYHYKSVPHTNWSFIDNPQLSFLNWVGSWNPQGSKEWVRVVPGAICSVNPKHSGSERINRLLRINSDGKVRSWQEVVKPVHVSHNIKRHALLVPSSPNCFKHYYGETVNGWIQRVGQRLLNMGWTYDVRIKPGRSQRKAGYELKDQLATGKYGVTISQHSVASIDSLLAGVPAVVTKDTHPAGALATPWEEFKQGNIRKPHKDDVEQWCDLLLGDTFHKSELKDGSFRRFHHG